MTRLPALISVSLVAAATFACSPDQVGEGADQKIRLGGTATLTATYDPDPSVKPVGSHVGATFVLEAKDGQNELVEQDSSSIVVTLDKAGVVAFPATDGTLAVNGQTATVTETDTTLTVTVPSAGLLRTNLSMDLICVAEGQVVVSATGQADVLGVSVASASPHTITCEGQNYGPLVLALLNEYDPLMELYEVADGAVTAIDGSPINMAATTNGAALDDDGVLWARGTWTNTLTRVDLGLDTTGDEVQATPEVQTLEVDGYGGLGVQPEGDQIFLSELAMGQIHAHQVTADGQVSIGFTSLDIGGYPREILRLASGHHAVALEDGVAVYDPETLTEVDRHQLPYAAVFGMSVAGPCLVTATDAGLDAYLTDVDGGLTHSGNVDATVAFSQVKATPTLSHVVATSRGPDMARSYALDAVTCALGDQISELERTGYGNITDIQGARGMGLVTAGMDLYGSLQLIGVGPDGVLSNHPVGPVDVRPDAFNGVLFPATR